MLHRRTRADVRGLTANQFSAVWEDYLGCTDLVVMKDITDDGTGHIDMFFKLVNPNLAVIGEYKAPYVTDNLNESRMDFNEDLVNSVVVNGAPVDVVRMPFLSKSGGFLEPTSTAHSSMASICGRSTATA